MKNTSRKSLAYQSDILIQGIRNDVECIHDIGDVDLDDLNHLIESLEGLKEIKIALATPTN